MPGLHAQCERVAPHQAACSGDGSSLGLMAGHGMAAPWGGAAADMAVSSASCLPKEGHSMLLGIWMFGRRNTGLRASASCGSMDQDRLMFLALGYIVWAAALATALASTMTALAEEEYGRACATVSEKPVTLRHPMQQLMAHASRSVYVIG